MQTRDLHPRIPEVLHPKYLQREAAEHSTRPLVREHSFLFFEERKKGVGHGHPGKLVSPDVARTLRRHGQDVSHEWQTIPARLHPVQRFFILGHVEANLGDYAVGARAYFFAKL